MDHFSNADGGQLEPNVDVVVMINVGTVSMWFFLDTHEP